MSIFETASSKARSLKIKARRMRHRPEYQITPHPRGTRRLGSRYGGWAFVDHPMLKGCDLISGGLGEDMTFDVEFAAAYGARVFLVDPTPRAVQHFAAVNARVGRGREQDYAHAGKEPAEAYDLSAITADQLTLIEAAIAQHEGSVRFYSPPDPGHVSYSINNYQNDYSTGTPFIEVPATSWESLLTRVDLDRLAAVKLDIEGAEIDVIPQILRSNVAPPQMMIEFDELSMPTPRALYNYFHCDRLLREAGYLLADVEPHANLLYVHESLYRD